MSTRAESLTTLAKLIKGISITMFTTMDASGTHRSRPMGVQAAELPEGTLWFFTSDDSPKSAEIDHCHQVNLSFAEPKDNRYVSISGRAEIVHDREKAKELWNPLLKAWFPKGLDEPHLALIRVSIEQAEYWDAPSSTMVQLAGFVKAVVTGQPLKRAFLGEHEKLSLEAGGATPETRSAG